jgi:hypothetical protein
VPAASFAMLLVSEGLPMEVAQAAVLRGLTAMAAATGIDPAQAEPAAKLLDWLDASRREVDRLPVDERSGSAAALLLGYDALGSVYAQARFNQLREVANVVALVESRLWGVPRHQIDFAAVRQITGPAVKLCNTTIALMKRLRPHVSVQVAPMLDDVAATATGHRAALQRLAG